MKAEAIKAFASSVIRRWRKQGLTWSITVWRALCWKKMRRSLERQRSFKPYESTAAPSTQQPVALSSRHSDVDTLEEFA